MAKAVVVATMGFFVRKNYRPARVPKTQVLSDSPTGKEREMKFTRYTVTSWIKRNVVLLLLCVATLGAAYTILTDQHHKFSLPSKFHRLEASKREVSSAPVPPIAPKPEVTEKAAGQERKSSGAPSDRGRDRSKAPSSDASTFNLKSTTGEPLPWKWVNENELWRRTYPKEVLDKYNGGEPVRPEITWFERRTVQDRLDFSKYINCTERKRELPTLDGLKMKSKLQVNDFIVHQGNYERLGKGAETNRTDRVRNVELLPVDGESVLLSRRWGTCAIVGNSGHLHFSEFTKSIDSHDTVIRVNQAPAFRYSRRVGTKTTHKVLNRLWTRTYRNSRGMKHGEVLPMEKDITFIVTRANTQEFELLQDYLSETRPDVQLLYMSSRATSMAQPLLAGYREKLCEAGHGPYQGLLVPSSGYVIIYFLMNLCDSVSVYDFGVKPIKDGPQAYPYHYYTGVGSRKVGDNVHSFDSEEMLLKQLGREGKIEFCMYRSPKNDTYNWSCGCRYEDVEDCRPDPLPKEMKDSEDCTPEDCETRQERQERTRTSKRRTKQRVKEREARDAERSKRRERERAAAEDKADAGPVV